MTYYRILKLAVNLSVFFKNYIFDNAIVIIILIIRIAAAETTAVADSQCDMHDIQYKQQFHQGFNLHVNYEAIWIDKFSAQEYTTSRIALSQI